MQSADAATPAPTYATPANSSSPCTVPSSPNGPCRIGSTTSTLPRVAGAFAAGTGRVSATEPSAPEPSSHCPSRPIATVAISYCSGSSPSSTARADASEISCSLERPPARTATRTRRFTGRPHAACAAHVPASVNVRPAKLGAERARSSGRPRAPRRGSWAPSGCELADHDRHRRALRRLCIPQRVLREHDAILRGIDRLLCLDAHLETGRL